MTQAFNQAPRSDGLLEGRVIPLLDNPVSAAPACWRARPLRPLACPITGTPVSQDGTALAQIDYADPGVHGRPGRCGVVKLAQDDNWLTVELSSGLLFNSGSAFQGSNAALCSIRFQVFSNRSITMSGCGATDNQPINNEIFRSNWTLSAAAPRQCSMPQVGKGVAPGRLAYEAYGEFSPVDNGTEQGRLQNRKVVVAISRFAWVPPAPSNR